MIASQAPSLPVFVTGEAVAGADVAAQCLGSITAIKAHDIISMYGSSHRHRRNPHLLGFWRLSKLTHCPMY
jgi:hypothetical protein